MHVFVQIEQVSQLSSLVESQLQYHRQAVQVLEELFDKLRDRYVYEGKNKHCTNLNVQLCYLRVTINIPDFCLRNLHACHFFFFF